VTCIGDARNKIQIPLGPVSRNFLVANVTRKLTTSRGSYEELVPVEFGLNARRARFKANIKQRKLSEVTIRPPFVDKCYLNNNFIYCLSLTVFVVYCSKILLSLIGRIRPKWKHISNRLQSNSFVVDFGNNRNMGIIGITDIRSMHSWSVVMITLLGFFARNFSARH